MSQEVSRWADSAMYRSEPMPEGVGKEGPRVTLMNATPDPLGSLAALTAMYEGRVVRDLRVLSRAERMAAFEAMTKTALSGPLEVAQFHFLVEGVTRSFTHQMVRGRQAFYAQESLRFAVVDEESWGDRTAVPPSVALSDDSIAAWDSAVVGAQAAYQELIDRGIPAEDARGLMPHAITTRLHWVIDLRGLLHVAGLRLCTQAQFEWRQVMAGVVKSLRSYAMDQRGNEHADAWQFRHIAAQLQPVCYQEGRCGFMAEFDRSCTIRSRVELNARMGRPSTEWGNEYYGEPLPIPAIHPREWATDATAARRR